MAKPGIKIVRENIYKLNANGTVVIEDNVIKMDISEDSDESEIIEIAPYFKDLEGRLVTLTIRDVESIEEENN